MAGKRWTRPEDRYLKLFYPTKGPAYCEQHLPGRTQRAIENRVRALGLTSGMPKGYVPLCWVAPRNKRGDAILAHALRQAKTDGVLRRFNKRFVKNAVPEWWADQYAKQLGDRYALYQRTKTWLLTRDLARMTGVRPDTIRRATEKHHNLGKHLQHVERVLVETPRRRLRWHPQQARIAINAWKATRGIT